jgi:phosphohistidine phosphatase
MKVYFFRHGIAADRVTWKGLDEDRPLTSKGVRQVESVAKSIARLALTVGQLHTSESLRALQTARILARRLDMPVRIDSRLTTGFGIRRLEALLVECLDGRDLFLVGHEPDFSETISALVGGGQIRCGKASLVRVDLDERRPLSGRLAWLMPPKLCLKLRG